MATEWMTGREFIERVAAALGLGDQPIRKLVIEADPDDCVQVYVQRVTFGRADCESLVTALTAAGPHAAVTETVDPVVVAGVPVKGRVAFPPGGPIDTTTVLNKRYRSAVPKD